MRLRQPLDSCRRIASVTGSPLFGTDARPQSIVSCVVQVLHSDLKTKNVLLTKDGTAKIGDVGLSEFLEHNFNAPDKIACAISCRSTSLPFQATDGCCRGSHAQRMTCSGGGMRY